MFSIEIKLNKISVEIEPVDLAACGISRVYETGFTKTQHSHGA